MRTKHNSSKESSELGGVEPGLEDTAGSDPIFTDAYMITGCVTAVDIVSSESAHHNNTYSLLSPHALTRQVTGVAAAGGHVASFLCSTHTLILKKDDCCLRRSFSDHTLVAHHCCIEKNVYSRQLERRFWTWLQGAA